MLHAYVQRFDMTRNLENFSPELNKALDVYMLEPLQFPSHVSMSHVINILMISSSMKANDFLMQQANDSHPCQQSKAKHVQNQTRH
jgi:hypothetical protein